MASIEAVDRRLVAIMFTDLVGYTSLTQQHEPLAMALLEEHRKILSPIFLKHGGVAIKTIGDAFLVEFASALEATKCARDIQEAVRVRNQGVRGNEEIRLRIGIHIGDVEHRGGDVYGDSVNIASRIEPLAEPGGICISEQVYDQVRNKVDLRFESLGPRELKNVELPVEVYRVELPTDRNQLVDEGADTKRIAVLPFVNISPDPKDDYFADGLTEELISSISNISELSVISRTSAMSYKGTSKKVREIGKELDVGSVLEGSVRKSGSRMRITVQLIHVIKDKHLWAQSYDREFDDVFAVQSDIAKQVADALRVRILPEETRQLEKRPTKSSEAYTLYLKGRYFWNERTKEALLKAIQYFKQATKLDPNFALAYSGIADSYSVLADHWYVPYLEAHQKQKENALKAVQFDDSSAEAHTSLASALENYYDWDGAEQEFNRAIELNPNYATAHQWYGILLMKVGKLDRSLREASKAQLLDPMSPQIAVFQSIVYDAMEKYDLAEDRLRKILEVEPNFITAHGSLYLMYLHQGRYAEAEREIREVLRLTNDLPHLKAWMAVCYAFSGRKEEARKILDEVKTVPPETYVAAQPIIYAHVGLGEVEKAIELIEREYEGHANWLPDLARDPLLASIKFEPRVVGVLKKIGLGT